MARAKAEGLVKANISTYTKADPKADFRASFRVDFRADSRTNSRINSKADPSTNTRATFKVSRTQSIEV